MFHSSNVAQIASGTSYKFYDHTPKFYKKIGSMVTELQLLYSHQLYGAHQSCRQQG